MKSETPITVVLKRSSVNKRMLIAIKKPLIDPFLNITASSRDMFS